MRFFFGEYESYSVVLLVKKNRVYFLGCHFVFILLAFVLFSFLVFFSPKPLPLITPLIFTKNNRTKIDVLIYFIIFLEGHRKQQSVLLAHDPKK